MLHIVYFLLIVNFSCSLQNIEKIHNSTENILCRSCGNTILTSDTIISKTTPASLYSFKDSLFNRNEVLVQLLAKDIFFQYPVITSSHSSCLTLEEWEEDELWFPDYSWKPCFCECGALIGWMFETNSTKIIHSSDRFFGLILTDLISENCKYLEILL